MFLLMKKFALFSQILNKEAFALAFHSLFYNTTIFTWLLCSITKYFHKKMRNSRLHRNNKNKLSIFYLNSKMYDEFLKRHCGSFHCIIKQWTFYDMRNIWNIKFHLFKAQENPFFRSYFMHIKVLPKLKLKWLIVCKIWIANYVLIDWIIKQGQLVEVEEY